MLFEKVPFLSWVSFDTSAPATLPVIEKVTKESPGNLRQQQNLNSFKLCEVIISSDIVSCYMSRVYHRMLCFWWNANICLKPARTVLFSSVDRALLAFFMGIPHSVSVTFLLKDSWYLRARLSDFDVSVSLKVSVWSDLFFLGDLS